MFPTSFICDFTCVWILNMQALLFSCKIVDLQGYDHEHDDKLEH
jgi:hypothetical protein